MSNGTFKQICLTSKMICPYLKTPISWRLRRIVKKPEFKIRIHNLRQSYASWLIHHGISVQMCATFIGDTTTQFEQTYGHLWKTDIDIVFMLIKQSAIQGAK